MGTNPYVYNATVLSVHDGDTLTLNVDLGFYLRMQMPCRVLGVNAPELSTTAGKAARDFMATLCPVGTPVLLQSVKDDKYGGRFDGAITLPDGRSVAQELIKAGVAAPWNGQGTKPLPAIQQ